MGQVLIKTAAEIQDEKIEAARKALETAIKAHADEVAKSRDYDDMTTLCSYVTSSDPKFAAEAQAAVEWRDALWKRWYEIAAEVAQGVRAIPTAEEAIALLPNINWAPE